MYKLLLCWRYLRTRYIALVSIVSVTLGVATMIVVNAVMAGFSHEMEDRMKGILSDVVVEGHGMNNVENPEYRMEQIRAAAGQWIEGMTPTVQVPGLMTYYAFGQERMQQIMFVGIDPATYSSVCDLNKYLQHPDNREQLSFGLRNGSYDTQDHTLGPNAPQRPDMERAGWPRRRLMLERQKAWQSLNSPRLHDPFTQAATQNAATPQSTEAPSTAESQPAAEAQAKIDNPPPADVPLQGETASTTDATQTAATSAETAAAPSTGPINPFGPVKVEEADPGAPFTGVVLGIALASVRDHAGNERFLVAPGDDVTISVPSAGTQVKALARQFTVVDFYESKMSEYDSTFVFVPIQELQKMRGIGTNVTSIQIKLKPGVDGDMVRDVLRSKFPAELFGVYTWRDKQGALLVAVQLERAVLNILLFMIIAVAGFGILAIFFMIVVEKTRDIGILKSLGASSRGIMGIFLGYGLSLGIVGSGVGLAIGLLFVHYINQIRSLIEWMTGQPAFDPAIYYFTQIPTLVEKFTVGWIVFGALLIAVLASVLPAFRAARLRPVEALRYE